MRLPRLNQFHLRSSRLSYNSIWNLTPPSRFPDPLSHLLPLPTLIPPLSKRWSRPLSYFRSGISPPERIGNNWNIFVCPLHEKFVQHKSWTNKSVCCSCMFNRPSSPSLMQNTFQNWTDVALTALLLAKQRISEQSVSQKLQTVFPILFSHTLTAWISHFLSCDFLAFQGHVQGTHTFL